ncbi:BspA family leucine-rich repeat surface protein, partial [Enterococcus sp. DIV2419]
MNKKSSKYLLFSTMLLGSFITTPITTLAIENDQATTPSDVTEVSKEIIENSMPESLKPNSQQSTTQSQETITSSQAITETENSQSKLDESNSATQPSSNETNKDLIESKNQEPVTTTSEGTYDESYLNSYFNATLQEDGTYLVTGIKQLNNNKILLPSKVLSNTDIGEKKEIKVTGNFWTEVSNYKSITEFEIKKIDNYEVYCTESKSLANLFRNATSLNRVNLEGYSYQNINNAQQMFYGCSSLTYVNLNADESFSSVTTVLNMFNGCLNLTEIDGIENADMSNVTDMYGMFYNCKKLKNLGENNNTLNWNAPNLKTMELAFAYCNVLQFIAFPNLQLQESTNITNMFWASGYTETLIVANDPKLLSYSGGNRHPIWKPNLNANGGVFPSSQKENASYISKVCMTPDQLTMEKFEAWKSEQIPTRSGNYHFMGWEASREILPDTHLLENLDVSYTARWVYSDWNFELDPSDQTYKLTEYIGSDSNVIVPGEIDGKPTKVDFSSGFVSTAIDKSSITSITFSEANGKKAKLIGNKISFENWTGLQKFDAARVDTTSINNLENAFKGCTELVSVDFSDCNFSSVTNMNSMFENTDNLKFINFNTTSINSQATMDNMFNV